MTLRDGAVGFIELYRAHFGYVWKSARSLGVGAADVDDVVQETFLTVHRLVDTYERRDAEGSERAWLFSVLYRIVQRYRRSYRRRLALNDEDANLEVLPGSPAEAPDKSVETSERLRILESILDQLDPERRAVLVLAEIEEKPVSEIAEILSIKLNTAASRLRLAREQVEAALARHRASDGWRYK